MTLDEVLQEIDAFLGCPTPDAWVRVALENQEILLIDHANCEKKGGHHGDESALQAHRP